MAGGGGSLVACRSAAAQGQLGGGGEGREGGDLLISCHHSATAADPHPQYVPRLRNHITLSTIDRYSVDSTRL